jgi:hypothetical protein
MPLKTAGLARAWAEYIDTLAPRRPSLVDLVGNWRLYGGFFRQLCF